MIYVDKIDIGKLFKIKPLSTIRTDGYGDGVILKFKTFYLKIYNEDYDLYRILGYRYKADLPLVDIKVKSPQLRETVEQFKEDNYLLEFE